LDALSCPSLKRTLHKTANDLLDTKYLFDETRTTCQALESQLVDKETYFNVRESELHELHRTELEKGIHFNLSFDDRSDFNVILF
jgi:hypothetical protein